MPHMNGDLAGEIARLANELFSAPPHGAAGGVPGSIAMDGFPLVPAASSTIDPGRSSPGAMVPPGFGPSALSSLGAGGASPSVGLPPMPGMLQNPPLAVAPPPREGDLRSVPMMALEPLGLASPSMIAMPFDPTAAAPTAGATPYFLALAGHPAIPRAGSSSSGSSLPAPFPDSSAAAPGATGWNTQPARTSFLESDPGARQGTAHNEPGRPLHPNLRRDPGSDLASNLGFSTRLFDPYAVRDDFPILRERVHGQPLVWLDNAATTQKPQSVIDRLSYYYEHENSNIHRGAHTLAARATDAYEAARDKVRRFLNAPSPQEIVFVRGATEAINLVAKSWGHRHVQAGDEIVISWLEHHANIVPWQQLASETGARLRVAPVDDHGQIILEEYEKLLNRRTRLVSVSQVSNALGTIVPVREMTEMAHRHGALVMIDGAQAVSHMRVDLQALDCDFYCFSGHKIFGPTGIGALFGKADVLETMPGWQGGGNMIADVTFEKTTYQGVPARFEAGTGNIADAVGLGAALDYVTALGLENIGRHEHDLLEYATRHLARVPGLRLIGTAREKAGVLSFVLDGQRTEEMGGALDREGIAVRSGHHCAQPILRRFGVESTIRASLAPYNTREDIDALVAALSRLQIGRPSRGF